MSIEKFNKQWEKIIKKVEKAIEKSIKQAASDTFNKIADLTPFGRPELWKYPAPSNYEPGTLKSAWQISYNSGSRYSSPRSTGNFGDKLAVEGGSIKYKVGDDIIMRNQTEYAYVVEHGSSQQAPAGMARIGLRTFPMFLESRIRKNVL
jgi:hypothetical protein